MVALPRFPNVTTRRIALAGVAAGLAVAAIAAAIPTRLFEDLVWTSGIAALVPAAQPPLGLTARALLAIAAGGVAGAVSWSILYLLVGPGGFIAAAPSTVARSTGKQRAMRAADAPPSVRRADAHPDAPPRRPISAADLGTPMMDVPPVERPLPRNLEQPLAAFDPAAIPATPLAPVRPVAPLPQPERRAEAVAVVRDPAPAPAAPPPSIETLLRRLEQGARARATAG